MNAWWRWTIIDFTYFWSKATFLLELYLALKHNTADNLLLVIVFWLADAFLWQTISTSIGKGGFRSLKFTYITWIVDFCECSIW